MVTCPACSAPGPFERVLVQTTAIEVVFEPGPDGHLQPRIPEDAEAREISAYPDGFRCVRCGAAFGDRVSL